MLNRKGSVLVDALICVELTAWIVTMAFEVLTAHERTEKLLTTTAGEVREIMDLGIRMQDDLVNGVGETEDIFDE